MLSREEIAARLKEITGAEKVITDEQALKECSVDRFRKYQYINGVYTRPLPAAIVRVQNTAQVSAVLKFLNDNRINCVARTGASATEGGLETIAPNSVVVDGSEMNGLIKFDPYNMQVTAGCGMPLEQLEDFLREKGYTTGHSPQSKPLAQLGGLVATRSIGQLSTLYGGIEDMVAGLEAVLPDGEIVRIKNVPRRAAGPDIRHIIIGSEGALCYITEVTLKIFRFFPDMCFLGYLVDDMETGISVLREVMVNGYKPSVARLYDVEDGDSHFSHFETGSCVLIFAAEGPMPIVEATGKAIDAFAREKGARPVDPKYIENWFRNLNWGPKQIADEVEEIKQTNNIGFTTEVSADWENIIKIYNAVVKRIPEEIPDITMCGGHSSHSYINGTNLYFVYYYNVVDCAVENEVKKYHDPINAIIIEETLKYGGSIVHHHGIGKARAVWSAKEHGSAYTLLTGLKKQFDPNGIMNEGTIFPSERY